MKLVKVIARQNGQYLVSARWEEDDILALAVAYDGKEFSSPAAIGSFLKFDPYWEPAEIPFTPPFDIPENIMTVLNMGLNEFRLKFS